MFLGSAIVPAVKIPLSLSLFSVCLANLCRKNRAALSVLTSGVQGGFYLLHVTCWGRKAGSWQLKGEEKQLIVSVVSEVFISRVIDGTRSSSVTNERNCYSAYAACLRDCGGGGRVVLQKKRYCGVVRRGRSSQFTLTSWRRDLRRLKSPLTIFGKYPRTLVERWVDRRERESVCVPPSEASLFI